MIQKVVNGELIEFANTGGGGTPGHTILNSSGTELDQRANLQFVGATVTDDSTNDKTVVTMPSVPTTTVASYTLLASGWSSGIYDLSATYPDANYNIYVDCCEDTTAAQITAFQKAVMVGSIGHNRIKATGTVPTIDIIVMVTATTK